MWGLRNLLLMINLGVRVTPDSAGLRLRKNQDVQFNGTVYAGNYEYFGTDFEMDYDSFLISMPQIDNIKFNLAKGDRSKQSNKEQIQNQLVETAGVLYQ